MSTVSAVVLTKNEARKIRDCLSSVAWADEIVVFDAGSEDATLDIASEFTDKIYTDSDWQGFGIQRQRAQAKVTSEWVFMIDADERVTPELQAGIRAAVENNDPGIIYDCPRLTWCFGGFIRHSGWYPDYSPRLYANAAARFDSALVHEKLQAPDHIETRRLQGDLLHYTYDDVEHYLIKSAQYARAWAEQRARLGKTAGIAQGVAHGLWCFLRMYALRLGFLDGKRGLLLALLSAHSTFAKYADLWVHTSTRQDTSPPQQSA